MTSNTSIDTFIYAVVVGFNTPQRALAILIFADMSYHPPMPPRAPGSQVTFLPLSEDLPSKSSRRAPAIPALISTRSSASLLRAQRQSFTRTREDNLEQGRSERQDSLEDGIPTPPSTFPIKGQKKDERKASAANVLMTPQMRSQRLIGNSNPRYRWEQYYKTEKQLSACKKPLYVLQDGAPNSS